MPRRARHGDRRSDRGAAVRRDSAGRPPLFPAPLSTGCWVTTTRPSPTSRLPSRWPRCAARFYAERAAPLRQATRRARRRTWIGRVAWGWVEKRSRPPRPGESRSGLDLPGLMSLDVGFQGIGGARGSQFAIRSQMERLPKATAVAALRRPRGIRSAEVPSAACSLAGIANSLAC